MWMSSLSSISVSIKGTASQTPFTVWKSIILAVAYGPGQIFRNTKVIKWPNTFKSMKHAQCGLEIVPDIATNDVIGWISLNKMCALVWTRVGAHACERERERDGSVILKSGCLNSGLYPDQDWEYHHNSQIHLFFHIHKIKQSSLSQSQIQVCI